VPPPSPTIRIMLAEDHALVRAGMRALLENLDGIDVVAEAADGREAIELIRTVLPDLVLMDITMPGLGGMATVTRVKTEFPQVRVVMLSMHDNEEYVWQALRAGAAGYLLKDSSPSELELAVRSVAAGGTYLSPSVSRHIVADYIRRVGGDASPLDRLTPRQREIVQLIAEGHSNQETANILGLSIKTIETHRSELMERLDIHDVTGIVRYAIRVGLISSDR